MKELVRLCKLLKHEGYKIIIETNGTISPIPLLPYTDSIVMDYKFEYEDKMDLATFSVLTEKDVIKFCISNDSEMYRAIHIQNLLLKSKCCAMFAYSPIIDGLISPNDYKHFVDELISMNKNSCIFSLQLHKLIGVQ
jgi:organic radical activating enzyme